MILTHAVNELTSKRRGSKLASFGKEKRPIPHRDSRIDIFGDLVEAIRPSGFYLASTERRLWITEASCRAERFLGLFLRLEARSWSGIEGMRQIQAERILARKLAGSFCELNEAFGNAFKPCGPLLQKIVGELIPFFSPAIGNSGFRVSVGQVALRFRGHRALILVAVELILYLIQEGSPYGRISVALRNDGINAALIVAADGNGFRNFCHHSSAPLVSGLSGIFHGEMLIRTTGNAGSSVEINFPYSEPPERNVRVQFA